MRRSPYVIAFFAILLTTIFNVIAVRRLDWVVAKAHSDVLHTKVTDFYGLSRTCQETVTRLPTPDKNGKVTYRSYDCRPFPTQAEDHCERENSSFCATWTGASYVDYLTLGFSAVAPLAILFGMSTHSRRRRVWKAMAGLTMLQCITGIISFALITDTLARERYPGFEYAKPGMAYTLATISWIISFLVTIGIAISGFAAEKGHGWATGNTGYTPING